jgi:hypothetical protein
MGGYLYAAGGRHEEKSVERYEVATNTWRAMANTMEGRSYSCAINIRSAGLAEEQDFFDSLIAKATRRQ